MTDLSEGVAMTTSRNREGCLCTADAVRLLDDLERQMRSTLRQRALEFAQHRRSTSPVVTTEDVRRAVDLASARSLAEIVPSLAEVVRAHERKSDAA
jgi:hypothetical protein